MRQSDLFLFEEEYEKILRIIERLFKDTSARLVVLVDKDGHQIAVKGNTGQFDTTSLASLTAGNVAATDGLAKLLGEKEFTILFHEGKKDNIHLSVVGQRLILVVIFGQETSLGLVRFRVKRASLQLQKLLGEVFRGDEQGGEGQLVQRASNFSEITDDDINKLFGE